MVAEMGSADRCFLWMVGLFLSINPIIRVKKQISECHPCIIQVYIMHISGTSTSVHGGWQRRMEWFRQGIPMHVRVTPEY